MLYKELYEYGQAKLKQAAVQEAELDARLLLEYICQTDRSTLFAHPEREISEEEQKAYEEGIEKRAAHIPLQQITGTQNFMGFDFLVNEHVLIPRQDTEILVEEVMQHLHDGMRLLDVCTGSGCILLSLLKYSNDCEGVGVDLSQEALKVAKENARILEKSNQATFLCGDLLSPVDGTFDIIVSNPPYIRTEVIDTLMPEVRDHEPRMALDGKEDGLYFYRRITEQAGKHLLRGGKLFFEIGFDQGQQVKDLMETNGFKEVEIRQDYARLDRVVYGTYYG